MGNYYDSFDELSEEKQEYIRDLNNQITSCSNCQPYDSEEKSIVWVYGDNYELSDLLYDNDIPEEYWEEIIPYLECPNCGRVFDFGSDNVGVMSKYESEFNEKYDEIVDIAKDKIQPFYDFISKYPYLGLEHEVGKEISNEIIKMPLTTIKEKTFFRARKPENGKIFTCKDMLNPPPETKFILEGRFNHYGQSHLYLGNSEALCAKEVTDGDKELLWMQKYNVKKLVQVLDTSEFIDHYNIDRIPLFFAGLLQSKIIEVQKSTELAWTPEYFIPRFIADIAKFNNINGIIYNSSKTYGRNLVIFDLSKCEYEFDGEPYTFKFDRKIIDTEFLLDDIRF